MSLLKSAILGGLSPLGLPNDRAVILMYHSISSTPDYFSAVTPEMFERQMVYLAERRYPVISLAELARRLEARELLQGSITITFDDGYRDNYTTAWPLLKKYNFPATIFVTSDLVGKSDKRNLARLSIEELKELEASKLISIEPHSRSHPRLAEVSAQEAREEIEGSKRFLEQELGKECRFFATPYGSFNDDTVCIIKELGFKAAVTVDEHVTVRGKADLFHLPRVSIDSSTTFSQFKGKLSRAVDVYEGVKRIIRV